MKAINQSKVALISLVLNLFIKNKIVESCRIQKQSKYSYKDWIQVSIKNLLVQIFRSVE